MDDTTSLQTAIQAVFERKGRGKVFIAKDFLHLSNRAAVDQALSRLARAKTIDRLGRGLYFCPKVVERVHLRVPPDPDDVAAAMARQTGSRVAPAAELAVSRLGLSSYDSPRSIYVTDGRPRKLKVAGAVIILKHVPPRQFLASSAQSMLVLQALRHLGPKKVDAAVITRLRRSLPVPARRQLLDDACHAPSWVLDLVRKIAE